MAYASSGMSIECQNGTQHQDALSPPRAERDDKLFKLNDVED
jgi:hypothetical protein